MKIKTVNSEYLEVAKRLSQEEVLTVMARITSKVERRIQKERLTPLEAIAIQLEEETIDLNEWRKSHAMTRNVKTIFIRPPSSGQ